MDPRVRHVDVPPAAVVRRFGPPVDGLELLRRKVGESAIPVLFEGVLWLRLDDREAYRAHYLLDEPTQGAA